ncbi:PAS domain-containing hybrid sensor histidine kinase/response regulator [Noviherbaspirillum aerium]|uniref:PAS domain-containing hybrid sensor histidine kinase/response regulator n=1 Tax=Noviherbaspirillum aerium TaxID=2588497 RepID=UPI00178C6FE2|nr:PAS domain S-box protein [Noviherbaspirillum aerium]
MSPSRSIRDLNPEQRLHLFSNHASDYGVIIFDPDGIIVEWTAGVEQITGWTAEEAIGRHAALIFLPEDRAAGAVQAELDTARRAGRASDVRWHLHKDGSRFFVDGVTTALRDADGTLLGFGKLLHDITQRKRMADFSDRQASLLDLSYEAAFSWDFDNDEILYWNRSAEELYGYASEEAVGQRSQSLLSPVFPTPLEQVKASLSDTGRWQGEVIHAVRGGKRIHVETRMVLRTDLGDRSIVLETNRDVTGQRQAEAAILASEERFRSLVTATTQMVWRSEADGKVLADSPSWRAFTGQTYDESKGYGWLEALHPDDRERSRRLWEQCIADKTLYETEYRVRRIDGEYRWTAVRAVPIVNADGTLREWIGTNTDIAERKRQETLQQENAERVRLATDAAKLGIWVWDLATGKVTWENERLYEMFGLPYSEEPLSVAQFLSELIHPDDAEPYGRAIAATAQTGARLQYEGRFFRRSDRSLRWFEFTGLLHRDANGHPLRVIGTAADITERKLIEENLRDARARLEAYLNAGEVATWIYDIPGNRMTADRNMARLFGVSDKDANGGPLEAYMSAVHPDDLEHVAGAIREAIDQRKPLAAAYRVRGADRQVRHVIARGKVEYDSRGNPLFMPGVSLDVTHQKEVEQALQARQERYGALFNSVDEGFCIIEPLFDGQGLARDFRFLEVNPAYVKQTGLDEVVGRTIRELVPDIEQRWIELYAKVARTGEAVRFVDHSPSMKRWFDVYANRIGSSPQVAVLFKDITRHKQTEEDLRQLAEDLARANRRQGEFLATLAHELRNPLAPIRTGLDLIRISSDSPATVARVREMMERQVDHLVHLVNDLLDLARINSGKIQLKMSRVPLRDIVLRAVETTMPAIEARRHAFNVRLPEELVWLDADPDRLAQVIGNLLTNAAKYTPEKGSITLEATRSGAEVEISVTDNGIGIPQHALPDIFDMFTQVRQGMDHAQGGLGIGLNLVKRLIEKHGGAVEVSSSGPDKGSRFTVRLPVASGGHCDSGGHVGTGEHAPQALRPLRILIADDNRDAAELLMQLLQFRHHTVEMAHDGPQALALARDLKPDLALLDIGMPGMNGYEVARAIRSTPDLERTVLVAVTGWGAREDRERSRDAGFDHHLTKPINLEVLDKLVVDVESK